MEAEFSFTNVYRQCFLAVALLCVLLFMFPVAAERRNGSLTASECWCPSALYRAWSRSTVVVFLGFMYQGMLKNRACFCCSGLALGASLAAVISEAQHQGPLLALVVWIDLWADPQMNGRRWEKQLGVSASSFVPVTITSSIKERAKTVMKYCWVFYPCSWGNTKRMGA